MFDFLGQVELPETGVDIGGAVTAAITGLGVLVVLVVGGYFAFLLVKKGMQWGGMALGGGGCNYHYCGPESERHRYDPDLKDDDDIPF